MIFHSLNCIFMHVERTGGVALRKHLLKYENKFERLGKTKHYTIEEAKALISPEIWDSYLKIGFVRNPYDRLVSWYCACKQNPQWESQLAIHIQNCESFEALVKNLHPKIIISQYDKVKEVDLLLRFENYAEDVKKVCSHLNIPYEDYKDNGSNHKGYREYYTPETKNIVSKIFAKDIKEFSYEF